MKEKPITARSFLISVLLLSMAACSQGIQPEEAPAPIPSDAFQPGRLNPDAPPETELLGRLAGVWDIEQENRNQDGSWREAGQAEWRWYYILDGHAIQDDWIKPPSSDTTAAKRSFGTNIRIYNADTRQWEMSWIDSNNRKTSTFTAVNRDGNVIMSGENAAGRKIRNTFLNIRENSFEWVQEWTFDDGESWVPVSRIRGTRRAQP